MKFKVVRDDAHQLVLEHSCREYAWRCVLCFIPTAVLFGLLFDTNLVTDWHIFGGVLCVIGVLAAVAGSAYVNPYRETITLGHSPQTLVIVRKRLLWTSRTELRFDELRAVIVRQGPCLLLDSANRQVRFPVANPPASTEDPDARRELEAFAAALRAAVAETAGRKIPGEPLPAEGQASARAMAAPTWKFESSRMKVVRNESSVVVLRDKPGFMGVIFIAFRALILVSVIAIIAYERWQGELAWSKFLAIFAVCGGLLAVGMYYLPYKYLYVFDRLERRILFVKKCPLRTVCQELDFDEVSGTTIFDFADGCMAWMQTTTRGDLDVTPSMTCGSNAVHRSNCEEMAAIIHDVLGLEAPALFHDAPDVGFDVPPAAQTPAAVQS